MKKQKTYIAVITIVIAILAVLLYLVSIMPSKDNKGQLSSKSNASLLISVDSDDISNINIKNTDEYNIKIESGENTFTYSIDKLDETQKISKDEVDGILNTFSKFSSIDTVEESCEDMSKFGLTNPVASVKITFVSGSEKTLYLGNQAPLNAGMYLKVDDGNTVYLIDKQVGTSFLKSASQFIDITPSPE